MSGETAQTVLLGMMICAAAVGALAVLVVFLEARVKNLEKFKNDVINASKYNLNKREEQS